MPTDSTFTAYDFVIGKHRDRGQRGFDKFADMRFRTWGEQRTTPPMEALLHQFGDGSGDVFTTSAGPSGAAA